jgi:hypothetical protein
MSIKSSIKSFTKNSFLNKLLTNVYLLYFISVVAFFTVIGNLMANKFTTVAFFILVFLLTKHFSNNMIIVLLVPLIFTSFFHIESISREGMDDGTSMSSSDGTNSSDVTSSTDSQSFITTPNITTPNMETTNMSPDDSDTVQTVQMTDYYDTSESFQVGDQKQKRTYEIDHASTLKKTYSDLSQSLGSDGIRKLTEDTTSLLKQQAQLGEAIKNMEPLITGMAPLMKSAEGIFGSLGMSSNKGSPSGDLSSLLSMANKLGGSAAANDASSV